MNLNIQNISDELLKGIEELASVYDLSLGEAGYTLHATPASEQILTLTWDKSDITIIYPNIAAFFRGLGHVIQAKMNNQTSLQLSEELQFNMNALMFDCSRNAVLNLDYVKQLIQKMALVGQNTFMLYMEDTFEIKEQPYFGYRRGRFTHDELREIDNYGKTFGIEVIPCIQTLAHVNQFLRWSAASKYRDLDDILLVGDEEVKELIDQMFSNLSSCISSNRIHVGMDEAYHLGRGKYLDQNGLQTKVEIMQKHLKDVQDIAAKYNKEIIIWDDMFFRGDSIEGVKLDNLHLMYWDYYHEDPNHYEELINQRRQLTDEVMYAGGAWKWMGLVPHHLKTLESNQASLSVCKKLNVKDVMVTSWGDDGSEAIADSCLFGVVLYGEHGYHNTIDMEKFNDKLCFITGLDLETHLLIDKINRPVEETAHLVNTLSKYVLYQDPLFALCETSYQDMDLKTHFTTIKDQLLEKRAQHSSLELYLTFLDILMLKWDLGINIRQAYLNQDHETLTRIIETQIEPLMTHLTNFKVIYRKEWLQCYKAYGFEVMDLRLSGLIGRLQTTKQDLIDYMSGKIEKIEALEEQQLPFNEGHDGLLWLNQYSLIVSGNILAW